MTVNNNSYCWVDQSQPDPLSVQQGPQKLPVNWQDPSTGRWYYNVNNPDIYSDSTLISIGWYPYVENDPGQPASYSEYYDKSVSDFIVTRNVNVVRNITYTQWEIERVREVKSSELESRVPQYGATELSADSDTRYDVEDTAVWVLNEIDDLADLTVWEDVAAFSTVLPDPMPLPGDYVGERQAIQGTRIVNEQEARDVSGAAPRSLPQYLTGWMKSCFDAMDDITGSTMVADVPAELRQDVNNPNEYRAQASLTRREEADGHGIRIKIRPTTGGWRTMVARIYNVSNTFLYELTFVEAKPGLWAAETPSAQRTTEPQDILAELGYDSSTPFTKRLLIPAGKQKITRRIRYNR